MLKTIFRKIAYVAAALIIFVAIIICATRILTPVADQHKFDIEELASAMLQMPVKIQGVNLTWHQYEPQISLHNVTILNKDTNYPALHVDHVNVFFSIMQSLWQRKPIPSGVMLSGANLVVAQEQNGSLSLQGFAPVNPASSTATNSNDVLAWIMQQPYLILRNINLHFTDKNQQAYNILVAKVALTNTGAHHALAGKAILRQEIPTTIHLEIQADGNVLNFTALHIRGYLYATGLSLKQWLKDHVWQGWQVEDGFMSAKIWAEWSKGNFQRIQTTFQIYNLILFSNTDQSKHIFNRLSGNVGWKKEGNTEIFAGDDILIDLQAHLWPVTNFYIAGVRDAEKTLIPTKINVGFMDMGDLQSILLSSPPIFSAGTRKIFAGLRLDGNLQDTVVTFPKNILDWKYISFATRFQQLQFEKWQQYPGFKNLSGSVNWDGKQGTISLKSNHGEFSDPALFPSAIPLNQLSGNLSWALSADNSLSVNVPGLQLLNNDLAVNLQGKLQVPQGASPIADLTANFIIPDITHVPQYLPTHVMSPGLTDWLQNAFLKGEIKAGAAVLRGRLADFPFDHGQGVFTVTGVINDLTLRFAQDWPVLEHILGKISFSGRGMTLDADHFETLSLPATNVHAVISSLGDDKPTLLNVDGHIETDFAKALNYVHASPLQKTLGKMFAHVQLQGPINLQLGLMIPLSTDDAIQVTGDLNMQDDEMVIANSELKLNKLNGQIQFTEKTTTAKIINAELFGSPFIFDINTVHKNKNLNVVRAKFKTKLDFANLQTLIKFPLTKYAQGTTDFTGLVDLSMQAPLELQLQSNLVGVALTIPPVIEKLASVSRDTTIQAILPESDPLHFKVIYGKDLTIAAILAKIKDQYEARSIELHADKMEFYGQVWHGLDLQVTPQMNAWKLALDCEEIIGDIILPRIFNKQSKITANLERLKILTKNSKKYNSSIDMKTLPALDIVVDNFVVNDIMLGKVNLKTQTTLQGVNIETLRIKSSLLNFDSMGAWTKAGTKLEGNASTTSVSELLDNVGFDVRNFVATKGNIDFDLSWNKPPYDFSMDSLNGSAKLVLASGRIEDIGQENGAKMGVAQLLSIFSLQTIPRRLTFDFSDITHKGYSFDSVQGHFNLRNGDAYTNDFLISGPIAKVALNGKIGMKNKDFNFTLIITPLITSSLPVAATATFLTGNPLIGLGAFAVNTVLGSQMSKATTYYYSVTGTWDNPVWKSIQMNRNTSA